MKSYEITIEPITFTMDFYSISDTICVKKVNPISIFNKYYDLNVDYVKAISKNVWHISASYGVFRLTLFPFSYSAKGGN